MPQSNQQRFTRTERPRWWHSTLHKRRAWFADEPEPEADEQPEPEKSSGGYAPKDLDEAHKVLGALEKRLGEREATIQSLNERLAAIEKAQRKKLEEEGNYRELLKQTQAEAEQLRMQAERASELESIIRKGNEERLKRLPEKWRQALPVDDLSPERLQVWLDNTEPLLTAPPPPDYDAGAGGGGRSPSPQLTAQELELAQKGGMTPAEWVAAKEIAERQRRT